MARLDRLAPVREVAQIAAAVGRQFSHEMISAAALMPQQQVDRALEQLMNAELIFRRGTPPEAEYMFKHALVQEAAYQSLLRSKRQQYHRQIAKTLEERFSEIVDAQPHLLAHHYTEADLKGQAIPYWEKAGHKAVMRSANAEAVNHFTKALELLKTMPETPECSQTELALQLALGPPLIAHRGFGSPDVGRVYARARELCMAAGEVVQFFPVLWGLWVFYTARAEHKTARELGGQCLRLAERARDRELSMKTKHPKHPELLMEAHHALGVTLSDLGEFSSALEHLEKAISLYDRFQPDSRGVSYGQDSGVVCRSQAAWVLWLLGHPDQALKRNDEALNLARQLNHPHSLAAALSLSALLHQHFRDWKLTQERAEAAVTLATEHELPFWSAMGSILHGWTLSRVGQVEEGITEICDGLTAFRNTGAEIMRSYFLFLLAEAYGTAGRVKDGLRTVAEAEAAMASCHEYCWEAELHRLKAELILSISEAEPPEVGQAEVLLEEALHVASRQNAKALELRSAVSLARLWRTQCKGAEAREMLAKIYGCFTEGLESADLQEANTLLGAL